MFLIRQAGPEDFEGVMRLAKILDSYNLPNDPRYVRQLLKVSQASFSGKLPKEKAKYLFVLVQARTGKIVGSSLVIAKHGTPGKPHLWLALDRVTLRSRTLGVRRSHQVLRLGFTEDGPTEVGGLVVLPGYRRKADRCGLQISFVRFLYMAMHPERFESKVLVEYRGTMGRGGASPFWQRIGHQFTGLTYRKADRLSVANKEFILGLMPRTPIYCALLPPPVRKAIGAIHPAAARAARLLEEIGFRPIPQVEPFDAGPYYMARRRQILITRRTRRLRTSGTARPGRRLALVAREEGGVFRALLARGHLSPDRWQMEEGSMRLLSLRTGERAYVCPL